jgi:ribosomal protein L30/L7E
MAAKLKVTQVKSTISHIARNRGTVRALGLHGIGSTSIVTDSEATILSKSAVHMVTDGPCLTGTLENLAAGIGARALPAEVLAKVRTDALALLEDVLQAYATEVAPGEVGAVITRYQGIANYDWIAMPLLPYLYAVENASEVPAHADKATVNGLRDRFGHSLAAGRLNPPIYEVLPLAKAADAHRMMKASEHFGKIVLRVR